MCVCVFSIKCIASTILIYVSLKLFVTCAHLQIALNVAAIRSPFDVLSPSNKFIVAVCVWVIVHQSELNTYQLCTCSVNLANYCFLAACVFDKRNRDENFINREKCLRVQCGRV